MNRRRFLVASAAAVLTARRLVSAAFADATLPTGERRPRLRVPAPGERPLLVLLIPDNDSLKWERGHAWGELLNHGSDAQLQPLGGVDLVCAGASELPAGVTVTEESWAVLLSSGGGAKAITVELPAMQDDVEQRTWEAQQAADDALIDRRIAAVADVLRRALPRTEARPEALAGQVRARYVQKRVPGSHWARAGGCGTHVEDDDQTRMPACGMGHVPRKSVRFLYLYAQTPGEQERARKGEP